MNQIIELIVQGFKADMAAGNPFAAILGVLLRTLGGVLSGIYTVIPSYAIAIALLTLLVRAPLWPLTAKQTKSMADLQKIQPEIQELKKKYKDDRVKLNEELMSLYQERKINPLGSCLPILIQGPVLFILWRVLGVAWGAPSTKPFSGAVTNFCTNELGQPSQCVTGTAFLPVDSSLFRALQGHNVSFFGIDLTKPGSGQTGLGWVMFVVLIIAVMATMWYQQRQMQKKTGAANPQMKAVGQIMPLFFGLLTYQLAGGLGIYFVVGNLFQIGQQEVLLRRMEKTPDGGAKGEPDDRKQKTGGFMAALREKQQAQLESLRAKSDGSSIAKTAGTSGDQTSKKAAGRDKQSPREGNEA
ncbi:MAG: hypothetical protein DCC49_04000, partial [Acidobacteria bacterium]